jgi:hypothetical protein
MLAKSEAVTDDEILTTEEAAALLKIHPITLFIWAREGKGPPSLMPDGVRIRRYSKRALLQWLNGRQRNTESEGARWMRKRAQAGTTERVECDTFEHGVEVNNSQIREGVRRVRR